MRAELAGRVDQISALHSERHQMQLEASCLVFLCHVVNRTAVLSHDAFHRVEVPSQRLNLPSMCQVVH